MSEPVPRVGVGVLILRADGAFLVGRRKGSHGAGDWALPGGHLELGESWATCAEREVAEECGPVQLAAAPRFLYVANTIFNPRLHYVTIFMVAYLAEGSQEPQTMEPHKCEGWEWRPWPACPEPAFLPLAQLVAAVHAGEVTVPVSPG